MNTSSRTIGGMNVFRINRYRMISSSSSSSFSTWRLTPIFALVLTTLLCINGEVSSEGTAFTPSMSKQLAQDNANISPISGKSSHQCDKSIIKNDKKIVFCRDYTTIPNDIPDKHEIKVLDMSKGNHLQTLKNGSLLQADLPMLVNLYLQNCQIHAIERGAFRGGNIIVELDLSGNRIEVLDPEVFSGLENLRSLKILQNPINRFQPGVLFPSLRSLTTLDFANCKLDNVPTNIFTNLKPLEKLSLKDNELTTLDFRVFKPTTNLHTLDLMGNPWHCDCHVKFLIDFFRERGLTVTSTQTTCSSLPSTTSPSTTEKSLVGMHWGNIPTKALACPPEIQNFHYISYDVRPPGTKGANDDNKYDDDDGHGEKSNVKFGQDVYFECEYSGYPRPEIKWFKDRELIKFDESARAMPPAPSVDLSPENSNNKTNPDNLHDSSSAPSQLMQKPKYEVQDGTFKLGGRSMDDEEVGKQYKFRKDLIIRRVQAEDKGNYECYINNPAGNAGRTVFLNLTTVGGGFVVGGIGGGKKGLAIWMWILVGVLIMLILVLLVLLIWLAWRRKDKKKQEGFRKVIQEKFKDSNVDLGDMVNMKTTSPNQAQKSPDRSEGAVPLLKNGSDPSTVLITDAYQQKHLPDVALANAELLRNSQIFSPKPPAALFGYPTDARKEFFARQISEPYLRPGSAMSLTRPGGVNASQRRYIFANQHYPTTPEGVFDQEHQYAVPDHVRTLPRFGSAMSMSALADSDLRRQMFLRQNSQPQPPYATAMRPHPQRRPPSTSSESQIDNTMMGAFNYSTLPRRPIRLQNWSRPVSPSGSTCSSYSTLSWRPMANSMIAGTVSDGVGPRTDALGGSTASLNKIPELTGSIKGMNGGGLESMSRAMNTPTNPGKVKNTIRHPRMGHSRTPSSLTRGHNDFFSFEPIQEVESSASNLNLEKMNGRQTPGEYSTQSLARGEPRYMKKKPPPIAFNPATLKAPSRAFDHLKGRSVSPANRNGDIDKILNGGSNPSARETIKNEVNSNGVPKRSIQVPILESPIDEVTTPVVEETSEVPPPNNRLSKSGLVPPPPPPKPKRSPNAEEDENETFNSEQNNLNKMTGSEVPVTINDGTVV